MQHKYTFLSFALCIAALMLSAGCSLNSSALPIKDDFAGECLWPEANTAEGSVGCVEGHYRVRTTRGGTQPVTLSFGEHVDAVVVEADAKLKRGGVGVYGVGCWTQGDSDSERSPGYFVAVASDGSYAIAHNQSSGDWDALVERGSGAVELRPGTNRIRAECVRSDDATTVVLSLNGAEIAVAEDPHGEGDFGRIGFVVSTNQGGTEVNFDNAEAHELSEDEARATAAKKPTPQESLTGLPITDDFSEQTDRWATGEDQFVSLGYADGSYRMLIKKPSPQWSYFELANGATAVRVSASTTKVSGSATSELGLLCYSSKSEGYTFSVSPGGGWAIFKETPTDVVTVKDGASDQAFGGTETAIDIEADCAGSANGKSTLLTLRVNGREVGRASDNFGLAQFSLLGLYGRDEVGRAEFRFDDFSARELTATEIAGASRSAPRQPKPSSAAAGVLYEDHFTEKSAAWPEDETSGSGTGHAAGGYRFILKEPESAYVINQDLNAKVGRVRIDVDARQPTKGSAGQSYGIACHLDSTTGYSFEINADDGRWSITSDAASSADQLATGFNRTAIRRAPATNHLRAHCDEAGGQTRLTLFVNNRKVGSAVDEDVQQFNSLALTATTVSGGSTVVFDNLIARRD